MFKGFKETLTNAFSKESRDKIDFKSIGIVGTIAAVIILIVKKLRPMVKTVKEFTQSILGILNEVRKTLEAYQKNIKADTLMKISKAIALLAAALLVLSLIDPTRMGIGLAGLVSLFTLLFGSMMLFEKLMGKEGFKNVEKISESMIKVSVAILILTWSVKVLSKIPLIDLLWGLFGIAAMLTMLVAVVKLLDKNSTDLSAISGNLIKLGIALRVMASTVKLFSKIDPDKLILSLMGLLIMLGYVILFIKQIDDEEISNKKVGNLIILAIALRLIAGAIKKLSKIPITELAAAVFSIWCGFIIYRFIYKKTADIKDLSEAALAMVAISIGMIILASALKNYSFSRNC